MNQQTNNIDTRESKISFKPSAKQKEILRANEDEIAILGGWGSGKTTCAGMIIARLIAIHGWHPQYGNNKPLICVVANNSNVLKNVMIPAILQFFPAEAIFKKNEMKSEYEFINGCRLKGYTAKSDSFEGVNPVAVWADEVHKISSYQIHNILSRYRRDKLATRLGRPKKLIMTGLPVLGGEIEEQFRQAKPNRRTFLLSSADNPFLDKEQIDAQLRSCPTDLHDLYILGKWGSLPRRVFPAFSMVDHVWDIDWNPSFPTVASFDPGDNYGATLIANKMPMPLKRGGSDMGLNVVDEFLYDASTGFEARLIELKNSKYGPHIKTMSLDPSSRGPERDLLLKHFPNADLILRQKGNPYNAEEYGLQCANAALKDSLGEVRIRFHRRLGDHEKGLFNCFRNYKRSERTGEPKWFDNQGDHAADACRYLCVDHLGIRERI